MNLEPCPKCDTPISFGPSEGGRGANASTAYRAECKTCGFYEDFLPSNCSGRRRDAEREYNRIARELRNKP
jgi:hypothetical protein